MSGLLAGELAAALFGLTARREVASHLREARQRPVRVAYRGDDDIGPEPRTVFTDAPPFVLEASLSCRQFELMTGIPGATASWG